jgi:hypothetical protein
MRYHCCDERRLSVLKEEAAKNNPASLNGLEYLEVHDSGVKGDALRQRTLLLKFLKPVPALTPGNLRIFGGERIKTVTIDWVARADALPAGEDPKLVDGLVPLDRFLVVRTAFYGDHSYYTLRLVAIGSDEIAPAGFDPRLAEVKFSFKVQCPSDFDCAVATPCPPQSAPLPPLNYLARDYATFRRLLLDRLSVLMPQWRERNAADGGVALVELLAYVGDHLSYRQDALATEAYLGTARRRVSLRRHARLVDYLVHEGCNARAWVRVFVAAEGVALPQGTQLLTRVPGASKRAAPASQEYREALAAGALVFETCDDAVLYRSHERLAFYTWGERRCCLPRGTTGATLHGHLPNLKAGDVLVFAEELGANTGDAADADRSHRCAVRLTHVRLGTDPSGGLFATPPHNNPVPVTEIRWAAEDGLPFPLCLSAVTDRAHGERYLEEVSAAYGNVVLADHGRTMTEEALGTAPPARQNYAGAQTVLGCRRPEPKQIPSRFRPPLKQRPLTHALPQQPRRLFSAEAGIALVADLTARNFSATVRDWLQGHGIVFTRAPVVVQGSDGQWSIADGSQAYGIRSAAGGLDVHEQAQAALRAMDAEPRRARPQIVLRSDLNGQPQNWAPQPDLLASDGAAAEFVVETEHDGRASLRFGDDRNGRRPNAGERFFAVYRVGNGTAGNVGAESIAHIVSADSSFLGATNPLPAQGGVDAENADDIRRDAPEAFRTQERAVTPEDYAAVTGRHAEVQRAAATFRWTGSWHTVFLTVDRRGGGDIDAAFESDLHRHVERFRMAGYDLEVDAPRFVPLRIELFVCVRPEYFRAHVKAALLQVFGSGWLPDGRRALFHPDNFSFGQPVYLSDLYAAAQSVEGVASVTVKTFQRRREPSAKPLDDGFIAMGRLEVAQLDNDPNFPERGVFTLSLGGGK